MIQNRCHRLGVVRSVRTSRGSERLVQDRIGGRVRVHLGAGDPIDQPVESAGLEDPVLGMLQEAVRHQLPDPAADTRLPSPPSHVAAASTKPVHGVQDVVDADAIRRAGLEHRWPPVVGTVLVEPQHGLDLGDRAVGTVVVRLVHDEQVGDLHDARLQRLHTVAGPGHGDDDRHVGRARDLDLGLPDTDRFDDDHIEPAGVQNHRRVSGRTR